MEQKGDAGGSAINILAALKKEIEMKDDELKQANHEAKDWEMKSVIH